MMTQCYSSLYSHACIKIFRVQNTTYDEVTKKNELNHFETHTKVYLADRSRFRRKIVVWEQGRVSVFRVSQKI